MVVEIIFRMMVIFSIISLLIGLSGVYSSVSLHTIRRRKEVAIRKINGASLGDLVKLFLRKYILLLLLVSVPAFILVYAGVSAWLDNYPVHAPLSLWLLLPVFVLMAAILIIIILYHLKQVTCQNPAEVVKSE